MAGSASADHEFDNDGELILTGSANAYVATTARKIKGYYAGLRLCARANFTCTGASTMTVDEAGPIPIRKPGNVATANGDIVSGTYYDFIYDIANTAMQIVAAPGSGSISNAELADMATQTIKARKTAGTGAPEDCTLSEVLDFIGSAAQGDILYRGASAWARLGAGTSGQFLKTNGAAANPAWGDAAGMVLLTSGTVSSAATLDIVLTSYTGYRALKFVLESFIPATDDVELWMRFSTNGGSSYDATGYSTTAIGSRDNFGSALLNNSASANQITIAKSGTAGESVSNAAAEAGTHCEIILYDQTVSQWPRIFFNCTWFGATVTDTFQNSGGASRETSQDTDAVRFLFESGNIASGKYAVYGLL